jgi:hypothetical protein
LLKKLTGSPVSFFVVWKEGLKSVGTILEGAAGGVGTSMISNANVFQKKESSLKALG